MRGREEQREIGKERERKEKKRTLFYGMFTNFHFVMIRLKILKFAIYIFGGNSSKIQTRIYS